MALPRLSFVLICLLGSGCASLMPTSAQRAASFTSYATGQIGDLSIHGFLVLRYAIVTDKADSLGSAAAIDRRGYYVTAAHCVRDKAPWLWVPRLDSGGHQATFEREACRVVWQGDHHNGGPDFAVLAISRAIERVFEWASEVKSGDITFAAGPNYDTPLENGYNLSVECIAGKILATHAHAQVVVPYILIESDAPMHIGDSGGPLTTTDGRLLGVNYLITNRFSLSGRESRSWSVRPDLRWLRQLIDDDYAKQTQNEPNKAPEPTPTAGTSAAEQPLVPAAVVAHL